MTLRFFLGVFAAAIFTNAIAVYLLHDVDPDRVGKLNLAYRDLTMEFLVFGLVLAVLFFLLTWIGRFVFQLRDVPPSLELGLALGIVVTVVQYPTEFAVRKLASGFSDTFLLAYLLLSPACCAVIVLVNSYKRRISGDAALNEAGRDKV